MTVPDRDPGIVKPQAGRPVLAMAILITALLTAGISIYGFNWIVAASNVPPDLAKLQFKMAFAAITTIGTSLITYLIAARPSGKEPTDRPTTTQDLEAAARAGLDDTADDTADQLARMTARKEMYKTAWQARGQALLRAETDKSNLQARLRVSDAAGRWYSRWFGTFLVATLFAMVCASSSIVQSWIQFSYRSVPGGEWPKWVMFFQTLVLCVCALVVPAAVYLIQRRRSDYTTTWLTAMQFGAVGTFIGGAFFLLAMPAELLGMTIGSFSRIPVSGQFQPLFFAYLVVQRVVVLPLIGLVGTAVVHAATPVPKTA